MVKDLHEWFYNTDREELLKDLQENEIKVDYNSTLDNVEFATDTADRNGEREYIEKEYEVKTLVFKGTKESFENYGKIEETEYEYIDHIAKVVYDTRILLVD